MLSAPLGYHTADEVVWSEGGIGEDLLGLRACPVAGVQPLLNERPVIGLQQRNIDNVIGSLDDIYI